MKPEQLALDLQIRQPPSLENFVVGDNGVLVSALAEIRDGKGGPQFLYIWGSQGVGCTHLLRSIDPLFGVERVPGFDRMRRVYAVDDVENLSPDDGQRLFDLMNAVRGAGGAEYSLVSAGRTPPARMTGRRDIVSRLSWGLVFQVKPLTDEQKDKALMDLAAGRGIALPADARQWMIEHLPRDMGSLAEALTRVERFAAGESRKITKALLRQCFQIGPSPGTEAGGQGNGCF